MISRLKVCIAGGTAGQTTAGIVVLVCVHHHISACLTLFQPVYDQFLTFNLNHELAGLNLNLLDQGTWGVPSVVHVASDTMTSPYLLPRSCQHPSPHLPTPASTSTKQISSVQIATRPAMQLTQRTDTFSQLFAKLIPSRCACRVGHTKKGQLSFTQ